MGWVFGLFQEMICIGSFGTYWRGKLPVLILRVKFRTSWHKDLLVEVAIVCKLFLFIHLKCGRRFQHANILDASAGNISQSLEAEPRECWSCWESKEVDTIRAREKRWFKFSTMSDKQLEEVNGSNFGTATWTWYLSLYLTLLQINCHIFLSSEVCWSAKSLPIGSMQIWCLLPVASCRTSWAPSMNIKLDGFLMYVHSSHIVLQIILLFHELKGVWVLLNDWKYVVVTLWHMCCREQFLQKPVERSRLLLRKYLSPLWRNRLTVMERWMLVCTFVWERII